MPINVISEDDFTPRSFEAARKHFARKAPLTHAEFERLTQAQKAKAFRIATLHNARMVQQVRQMLDRAIESGASFADFRRAVIKYFEAEGQAAPALNRLRLAFHQNTMRAYSEARREVLDDPNITEAFPFRQYVTVGNGTAGFRNVRADHAILHGKVFAWDDPFWDFFTPPWDYGCRCTFIALTARQAAEHTIWTYVTGAVIPVGGVRRAEAKPGSARAFALEPNPNYSIDDGAPLDLSGLDEDLRAAVESRLGSET